MGYSNTMQELKKAGVVATEGYYRGPPQIIKLDVECTGEPKVRISPVLTKETMLYKGKQHVQFNSMYVCTLKVAGERHGITVQAQRGGIIDFGFLGSQNRVFKFTSLISAAHNILANIIIPSTSMVGAALEISLRIFFFKHFFSQCKLVDMVCRMKSHHKADFKKVIFLRSMCVFLCFFLVLLGKMRFRWFSCCFHCCLATCVAFRPPLLWIPFRLFQHMFCYLWITMLQTSLVPLYLNNSSVSVCITNSTTFPWHHT